MYRNSFWKLLTCRYVYPPQPWCRFWGHFAPLCDSEAVSQYCWRVPLPLDHLLMFFYLDRIRARVGDFNLIFMDAALIKQLTYIESENSRGDNRASNRNPCGPSRSGILITTILDIVFFIFIGFWWRCRQRSKPTGFDTRKI